MKIQILFATFGLWMSLPLYATIIVGLDPTDPSNLLNLPSGDVDLITVVPTDNAAGLTMNVVFTPSAIDVGVTGKAITLVEIGGNANGTGLYLLDGELYFLGKMQGLGEQLLDIANLNDLDYSSGNNMVGVKSSFGILTAGIEYSVGVIYNPVTATPTLTMGVFPEGGSLAQEIYTLTGRGTKDNWSGNDTITAFFPAANAGGGNFVAGDPFREGPGMSGLDGAKSGAYLWNAQGVLNVTEPFGDPTIASISRVSGDLWELVFTGSPDRDHVFRSSPFLDFSPGSLVENLSQGDPADAGTIGGPSNSVFTTDASGKAVVRMLLGGTSANFVRAVEVP